MVRVKVRVRVRVRVWLLGKSKVPSEQPIGKFQLEVIKVKEI